MLAMVASSNNRYLASSATTHQQYLSSSCPFAEASGLLNFFYFYGNMSFSPAKGILIRCWPMRKETDRFRQIFIKYVEQLGQEQVRGAYQGMSVCFCHIWNGEKQYLSQSLAMGKGRKYLQGVQRKWPDLGFPPRKKCASLKACEAESKYQLVFWGYQRCQVWGEPAE